MVRNASNAQITEEIRMAIHGVPYFGCRAAKNGGRYPSSDIVDGIRVLVSNVAFSSDTLQSMAAAVIRTPSQLPPISLAAVARYVVFQSCQLPNAANESSAGRK